MLRQGSCTPTNLAWGRTPTAAADVSQEADNDDYEGDWGDFDLKLAANSYAASRAIALHQLRRALWHQRASEALPLPPGLTPLTLRTASDVAEVLQRQELHGRHTNGKGVVAGGLNANGVQYKLLEAVNKVD